MEQLERPTLGTEPGAARVFTRRSEQLHFVDAELDAEVVAAAGFSEAGADAVEFGEDG